MSRQARCAPGGMVHHVLNRSAGKFRLFRTEKDFQAFENLMVDAHRLHPTKILAYCVMPTHWHFVTFPDADDELTGFFRWLAHTHAMRWRVAHETVGYGHLYQGRFKNFPVQTDEHLLTVLRYVERNALTAGIVDRAEDWRWSSLWARANGTEQLRSILSEWPVDPPADWARRVNQSLSDREIADVTTSIKRGRPFGDESWVTKTAKRLDLDHTLRREGRPKSVNVVGADPKTKKAAFDG